MKHTLKMWPWTPFFVLLYQNTHDAVAESAVVGFPHDIKGEGVYAYVILKDGVELVDEDRMIAEMKALVKTKISGFAVPEYVQVLNLHLQNANIMMIK